MARKPAISGVVQVKALGLDSGLLSYFTHGNILESRNGHICSLLHTNGIFIVPVHAGAKIRKSGKDLRQCSAKRELVRHPAPGSPAARNPVARRHSAPRLFWSPPAWRGR